LIPTYIQAGLPDDIFSKQKSQFGYILEGLSIENVGILLGHLKYIKAVWYFYGHLVKLG
jgi:hypothetical protein